MNDIEIICVDDKSTDNSLNILQKYARVDSRIKIIQNSCNQGLGASRNNGIKHVQGKYILFVDSDDWIKSDTCEKSYDVAEKFNLDILMFKILPFNDKTKKQVYTDYFSLKNIANFENVVFNHNDIKKYLFSLAVCAYNKLYKTEFILNNHFTFVEGLIFEDECFFYDTILHANRISFINNYFYNYRLRYGSIINSRDERFMDLTAIFKIVLNLFIKMGNLEIYKKNLYIYFIGALFSRFSQINKDFKEQFFIKIKLFLNSIIKTEADYNILNYSSNVKNLLDSPTYQEYVYTEDNKLKLSKILSDDKIEKIEVSLNNKLIVPYYFSFKEKYELERIVIHKTKFTVPLY